MRGTVYFGYQLDNDLACHPNASPTLLRTLYSKGQLGTDLCLARNPNTPSDILLGLSASDNEWIQKALADNPEYRPGTQESSEIMRSPAADAR